MSELKEADLDTVSYDSISVNNLLFEGFNGEFPVHLKNFSICANFQLLKNWIRQPSPCCAAAAIVGAWNCVIGIDRDTTDNPFKLTLFEVLDAFSVLAEEYNAKIDRKISTLTSIDESTITSLRQSVCRALIDRKLEVDAAYLKKKKLSSKIVKEATLQQLSSGSDSDPSLICKFESLFNKNSPESIVSTLDNEVEDEVEGLNTVINIQTSKPFLTIWSNHINKCLSSSRLTATAPSTASIGNLQLVNAITLLSSRFNDPTINITANCIMGHSAALDFPVSVDDDEATISRSWQGLCNAISTPNVVLIGHITNHYTLLFATRSFVEMEGSLCVRQVLLAKKGQKPAIWMDFSIFREILLYWNGYKVISIKNNT